MNINIPGVKTVKNQENEAPNGKAKATKQLSSPGSVEATSTESQPKKETPVVSQPTVVETKPKKKAEPLKMPDLFANVRIKNPESFYDYPKVQMGKDKIIPDHYCKFIEPVYDELQ